MRPIQVEEIESMQASQPHRSQGPLLEVISTLVLGETTEIEKKLHTKGGKGATTIARSRTQFTNKGIDRGP